MIETYTSLHNHTDYSNALLGFPDSVCKTEKLIQYAYDIGLNGISITEHEGISSYIKAEKYYNSMKKDRPFKLILGNEIYLLNKNEYEKNIDNESNENFPYYHFLLNALDSIGNKYIRQLSTLAWNRSYYSKGKRRPTLNEDLIEIIKEKGHLIAGSGCLGGRLPKLILKWKEQGDSVVKEINEFIDFCIEIFGEENFYLEVQPCKKDNEEQIFVNETMKMLSNSFGLKIISTTDSHYLKKEDSIIHSAYLRSKDGGDSRETDKFYSTTYLMSPKELREYLLLTFSNEEIDEIFNNTNEIANKVQDYSLKHNSDIPVIPKEKLEIFKLKHLFKDYYNEYKNIEFYANNEDIYKRYFMHKLEEGMINIVHYNILSKDNFELRLKRLDFECGEIKAVGEILDTNMESYFTTIQKIIDLIWDEGNSLVGAGRGSSMCFSVNYILGINQIDPIPLGDLVPYWRFLSVGRSASLADVDIDIESSKKDLVLNAIKNFWGNDYVLQCATFAEISSKTSILKGGKGLGYNDDEMNYLASLIPVYRGKQQSLEDTLYGNEKKEIKPSKDFINELSKYPNLKETILGIQGIITQMGIHAGAVNVMNNNLTETTSCMIAPNGNRVSAFDLHDEEYTGTVKFDLLSIDALQKIRKTMDFLLQYNYFKWQGTLRATYDKYLHPSVIEYKDKKMWDLLPHTYSCFQWDSPVGNMGINKIQPKTLMELTTGNSLIRLQSSDGISPLDVYVRYKNNINEWYKDMKDYGLNEEEISIMKEYLLDSYGVMENQETCMRVSMDKRISNFTLGEADKLRKTIAKGDKQALAETESKFYSKGIETNCRKVLLDYVWKVQIHYSLCYSFSFPHSYEYSVIAVQELNLNFKYSPIYWNTACLTVESQSDEENERSGNTNYGKIAKAIYKIKRFNTEVLPPYINNVGISFTPNEEDNTILFGIGGIAGINIDIAKQIIENRPYNDFEDFYNKHSYKGSLITKSKFITLIKAGCFDKTDDRITAMKWLTVYENPKKESLTMANLDNAISLGITLPKELIQAYKFKKYVLDKKYFYCNDPKFKSKKHYIVESQFALPFLEEHYISSLVEEKDYYYTEEGLIIIDKSLEKILESQFNQLKEILNSEQTLKEYNRKMLESEYIKMIKVEDINKWSFDSISFYANGKHELDGIDFNEYNISHFADLPEEPLFIEKSWGKRSWKQYDISRICGTVLDRTDQRHMIDILTPDNEVVSVKFNAGQYSYYKQTIEDDENYFKRGNMLMISGYRRGEDEFVAKKYKNSIFIHSVIKILKINEDKTLELQLERIGENEGE